MSCPYFKEGYAGICIASPSRELPSIAKMELYCFRGNYHFCPNLARKRALHEETGEGGSAFSDTTNP